MAESVILGFFDGIHAGHRALILKAINYAGNGETILLTFQKSPSLYFNGTEEYIRAREESVNIIKNIGVSNVVETDFSSIAKQSAEEYLKNVLAKYSPKAIFSGFNHTFGYNKQGTPDFLKAKSKEYGFLYYSLEPYIIDGEVVSSTRIKQLIKAGNIQCANKLLVDPFSISGLVIKGSQIGRTIGYPTANIEYPKNIVKLPYGVFGVSVNLSGEKKKGIMNWGIKPTVNNEMKPIAEVHILDFDGNLYEKEICINIENYIRNEIKFSSVEKLKEQIKKDIECLK